MSPTAAWLSPRAAGAAFLALGAVVGAALAVEPLLSVLAIAGLVVALLLAVPRSFLPAAALAAYAVLPISYLPVPELTDTASPSVLLLLVWAARLVHATRTTGWRLTPAVPAVLVLATPLLLSLLATSGGLTSVGWTGSFAVNVLLPMLLLPYEDDVTRRRLMTGWCACAAVVGGWAAAEALLRWNPLVLVADVLGVETVEQGWAFYRSTATLGHPLETSAFLAVSLPLCLDRSLRARSRGSWVVVVLAAAGLLATGSRGPTAAALAGCGAALWVHLRRVPGPLWRRRRRTRLVLLSLPLVPVLLGGALALRSGSSEGAESSSYRLLALREGWAQILREPLLGVGPGASGVEKALDGGPFATLSYENGWLEVAVSVGLPFALLLLAVSGTALLRAARGGAGGLAGAMLASVFVIGSSNVMEGSREGLVRWGLLLALALCPGPSPRSREAPRAGERQLRPMASPYA